MVCFRYDFTSSDHGWVAGFADYDVSDPDKFQLQHGFRERPVEVGNGGSLFISGMNRSDDLFMYYKHKLTGLEPKTDYFAMFRVTLASKYVSAIGAGGDPAKSVYLKACAVPAEPALVSANDVWRLNIDIGKQAFAGKDSTLLGDIEKLHDDTNDYALISRESANGLAARSSDDGSLWILFGTDSGYEGETAVYYTAFEFTLDMAGYPTD